MNRHGFSLIEMLAVLTIVSIVAVSVTFSWGRALGKANYQHSIERVIELADSTRAHASRSGTHGQIRVDMMSNSVDSVRWIGGGASQSTYKLPQGVSITSYQTAEGEATSGEHEIAISRLGATKTWALRISQDRRQTWIVFAGRSGQSIIYEKDDDVGNLFTKLRTKRVDSR